MFCNVKTLKMSCIHEFNWLKESLNKSFLSTPTLNLIKLQKARDIKTIKQQQSMPVCLELD